MVLNVDPVRITGFWWRHTPAGADPSARSPVAADGRWQRAGAVEALYLADSADTVWAEWYRLLAELAVPPHRALPRDLWRFRLDIELADLSTADRLATVGLDPPKPVRSEWPKYQDVGEALFRDGIAGLVAPSAARPTGRIVCLFRAGERIRGVRRAGHRRRVALAPVPPTGMTT